MSDRNEKIQERIAWLHAKNTMNQFLYLELIDFEEYDSHWVELFETLLQQFRKIDSEPIYIRPIGDTNSSLSWFESVLDFLEEKQEWLVLVPNCSLPIWANVRVMDFTKAIEELWKKSGCCDVIIADKSTGRIAQIFSEEKNYEIHIGKVEIQTMN